MTVSEPTILFNDHLSSADRKKLTRVILRLAVPIFIGGGINAFVGFMTRIFISELGEVTYNSVNLCLMVFYTIILVVVAISIGTTTLVAQNWGGNQKDRAGEILKQSLIHSLLLGFLISLFGLLTRRALFQLLGMDEEMTAIGSQFLFWVYLGLPFFCPGFFMAAALRGAGDTRTPMIAGLVMSAFSLVLSYGLILGKLGMPKLEAVGAAIAINASFLVFTVLQAVAIFFNRTVLNVSAKSWRFDYRTGASIMKIGLPSAGEWSVIRIGFVVYVTLVGYYGHETLAGFFTGIAILSLTHSLTQGIQIAATTLVGQAVGAKDFSKAESIFRLTALIGFVIMAVCALVFAVAADTAVLSRMFPKLNASSIEYARDFILLICLVMPLMGSSFAVGGGLRGAGSTKAPLYAAAVGVYGGRIGFAFLVYYLFQPSVYVIWCSMFPDLIIRLLIMLIQVKSGKWKAVKIKL
ncbi:MAG: MATE family efflux transporter [Deltaproteobacteria bacterium]|nr:MATE family efflux transporter [Deltaproteobacteria bacterium]MBT4642097.1 MATE family efflux transporter [Deltaproteobacteria bacterium]MBT6614740.1 MATE family efflux transporter [Deltaproteobacteria bacterium]MBT7155297.1 MATE family efflux transporter [Deltaproteobacteria bacterium]MBT7710144.1 MATE family efflux transporter [Deltaproteobacteria bacterium]